MEKKGKKIFGGINKKHYLCPRYPENNLFTLKETNTYWRFGAVACEGHRFFFALNFPSSLAQTSQAHIQLFIHFIQYVKKKIYHIAFSSSRRKYHTPLPTFIFPWASKNFSVGTQKKSWAACKKKSDFSWFQ